MSCSLSTYYQQNQHANLTSEELAKLQKKDGAMYTCVGHMPNSLNPNEEKTYIFAQKKVTFEELEKIKNDTYPALEYPVDIFVENCNCYKRFFEELGYSFQKQKSQNEFYADESYLLGIPNHHALQANWEKLRKRKQSLPPLKICNSKGIASDQDFIESFLRGEIVLSNGKEFMHDHSVHIMTTLIAMKKLKNEHMETRETITNTISKIYELIQYAQSKMDEPHHVSSEDIASLMFALAYLIDVATANFHRPNHPAIHTIRSVQGILDRMKYLWSAENKSEEIQSFYQRQFGCLTVSSKPIETILGNIVDLAQQDESLPPNLQPTLDIVRAFIAG